MNLLVSTDDDDDDDDDDEEEWDLKQVVSKIEACKSFF